MHPLILFFMFFTGVLVGWFMRSDLYSAVDKDMIECNGPFDDAPICVGCRKYVPCRERSKVEQDSSLK